MRGNRHAPGCQEDHELITVGITTAHIRAEHRNGNFHPYQLLSRLEGRTAWKWHPGKATPGPHLPL